MFRGCCNEYFKDLLSRSLFQEIDYEYIHQINGATLYYKMHDLIHDLAQSVVKSHIIILIDDDVPTIPKRVHDVSLYKASNEVHKDVMDNPVRTVFMRSSG